MNQKITVPGILAHKNNKKITMITAYDTPSASIADKAGADILLVGDSVMTTVLGHENTLQATVDIMVYHTAAVARAKPNALIVSDMPWLSYHVSVEDTVRNAGRLIKEGQAEAVKLEGGRERIPAIQALVSAQIPVIGHLGLTPQSIHTMGGYKVQGKTIKAALKLLDDAKAITEAGVFAIVLEGVPAILAKKITEEISVPTIGIGAGVDCDGQVLVFHDVLGMIEDHTPKFVRKYSNLANTAEEALRKFFSDVEAGTFPSDAESYHMSEESVRELQEELAKKDK